MKNKLVFNLAVSFVVFGVGFFVESTPTLALAMQTKSLLGKELPRELKMDLAQNRCERIPVAPARETRKITEAKIGFSFNIPNNYRTEKRQDGANISIHLYNPGDDKLLECCKNNRLIGCGHGTLPVTVRVQPATPVTRLLRELSATTVRLENIKETTIAQQKALAYVVKSSMDGGKNIDTSLEASFFTPDQRHKITISVFNYGERIPEIEEKAFNLVISSFAFDR